MQKENRFFFSLLSESTFDEVKGTNQRAKHKINARFLQKTLYLCNIE